VGVAPRVSVVLPTHNRADLLPRALSSVLAQTEPDLEVVVVDSGSTDDTALLELEIRDERVRWVRVEARGVSAARNAAISVARGEWIAFLDDDNEWSPTFLARQLDTAVCTGADVVFCAAVEEWPDGRREPHTLPAPAQPGLDAMTRGWYPFMSSVVVRRRALVAVGGFANDLAIREDWHLLVRLALREQFAQTADVLMVRHHHGGPRLGGDEDASLRADWAIDRELGRAIRHRAGSAAYVRWFRRHCGEDEIQRMWRAAPERGRGAATWALRALAGRLPWSVTSMARPAVVTVVGPTRYLRLRRAWRESG
jgi:glycosyltransferase involved in cell wall biosynthesis